MTSQLRSQSKTKAAIRRLALCDALLDFVDDEYQLATKYTDNIILLLISASNEEKERQDKPLEVLAMPWKLFGILWTQFCAHIFGYQEQVQNCWQVFLELATEYRHNTREEDNQ